MECRSYGYTMKYFTACDPNFSIHVFTEDCWKENPCFPPLAYSLQNIFVIFYGTIFLSVYCDFIFIGYKLKLFENEFAQSDSITKIARSLAYYGKCYTSYSKTKAQENH